MRPEPKNKPIRKIMEEALLKVGKDAGVSKGLGRLRRRREGFERDDYDYPGGSDPNAMFVTLIGWQVAR
jgi:hypothetical protein